MELTDNDRLNIALQIMTDKEVEEYQEVIKQHEEDNISDEWENVI